MKEKMHKIRVLIPFRNVGEYIIDCVNSLVNQQYSNYEVYLLDDQSTDGTLDLIDQEFNHIHKIRNEKRLGSMESVYQALINLAFDDDDIVILLDGDDYLFGDYTFQLLNAKYNEGVLLTYGQYITNYGVIGSCRPYTKQEFLNLRKAPWKSFHLKTFKYQLFKLFLKHDPKATSFKFDNGVFFTELSDIGMMLPLMEIAGYKNIFCFQNVLYCYRQHIHDSHDSEDQKRLKLNIEHCIRNRAPIVSIENMPESMTVSLKSTKGHLETLINECFQSRGENTLRMVEDAMRHRFDKGRPEDFNLIIHTGDFPEDIKKNNFYYCCANRDDITNVIPDYAFYSWKEAGINQFDVVVKEITAASRKKYIYDKLFWIGNIFMNKNRKILMDLGLMYCEKLDIKHTEVDRHILDRDGSTYVSLIDHCQYKYLLDVEGIGYSGRLKFLLFSGRLLFIQERRWKEYFHFDLIPYEHFIPVKNDLSDLILKLEEVEGNAELYERITSNAMRFAQAHLNYESSIKYMASILWPLN